MARVAGRKMPLFQRGQRIGLSEPVVDLNRSLPLDLENQSAAQLIAVADLRRFPGIKIPNNYRSGLFCWP